MSRLDNGERRTLLDIAHRAIANAVAKRGLIEVEAYSGGLKEPAGAFVTLRRGKRLRGCIGRFASDEPLARAVALTAVASALEDPRFEPLRADEVSDLEIEISVLSPFQQVIPEEVRVGVHGLMIQSGGCRGLLLPQVAVEYKWSAERFLEETCSKAGLPRDAWRDPETRIYAFSAEVFSDRDVGENKSGASGSPAPPQIV